MSSSANRFDAVWAGADAVPGWLTRGQAARMWQAVGSLEPGSLVVEIGSHRGRSTIVLAGAARTVGARVVAIDPFVEGRQYGGGAAKVSFERNITAAGLADVVDLRELAAAVVRRGWQEPVGLVYVDGKHDFWSAREDLRWSAYLVDGATLLVHDCFSSVGVTSAVLWSVLGSAKLRYDDRVGSLATFTRDRPTGSDRLRILAELPWWGRNLAIKVLLRLRLRGLARRAGHDHDWDPY
ncbi:MAG: class I SAM-dependent methyltransferase [Actinomycetota bacterium]|nr:class I SAM-dependent methyltransferase [Actinomycetota bacterium]